MNLLLLLLLQDYFKNMHTAKTTQNKEKKNNGINGMEGTNNRICGFRDPPRPLRVQRIAEEITRRKRERLWKFADVRRGHSVS